MFGFKKQHSPVQVSVGREVLTFTVFDVLLVVDERSSKM